MREENKIRCKGKFRIVIKNRKDRYTISFRFFFSCTHLMQRVQHDCFSWVRDVNALNSSLKLRVSVGYDAWMSNRRSNSHHPSNHMRFGCLIREFYCLIWFGAWLIFAGYVILRTDATLIFVMFRFFFVHFTSNIQHLFSIKHFFSP